MQENIHRQEFIRILNATPQDRTLGASEKESLNRDYNRFIDWLQGISKQSEYSMLDSLQLLARIRETLVQLLENYNDSASLQCLLIRSSLSLVDFEQRMIYL